MEENFTNISNSSDILYDLENCTFPETPIGNTYSRSVYFSIFGIISIIALIGNSSVCYVVLSSPRMRTVTNYFITNLAIGDLLIATLCIPFTSVTLLNQYWSFGAILCPLIGYLQALSVFGSCYTLVAISIDRYMVIMWPMKPRISKACAMSIIACVWLVAGVTVLPIGLVTKLSQPDLYKNCDKYLCNENWSDWPGYGIIYTNLLMVLQYVIPAIVLIFTYTSIGAVMCCHKIPGEAENSRDQRIARSKRKMVKMMIVVVFVYTICWVPFNVVMIFLDTLQHHEFFAVLYLSTYALAMSHAMYNPVIYCYMNSRFRDGFRSILRIMPCFKKCCNQNTTGRRSAYSSGGTEGTESTTILHRNNTSTTYISLRRKCPGQLSLYNQAPVRSASLRNNNQVNGTRRRQQRLPFDVADEPI